MTSLSKAGKIQAYHRGLKAEADAENLLAGRGYEILSRRYRSPAGEIDLVAARGAHLAFVEVKARRSRDDAAWSVTPRQQRRIADAASYWLQSFPEYQDRDISFDAVLFAPAAGAEYISDAFRPGF
ncbi:MULTISPECIES: YraN family protein [Rhodomicrobium]|uniref:YraN family protein n=1 Tax=Rhodomicrobium TaxID=1068 RepID=UPI000B4A6005|nr:MULTISPECIES: YraN family protein [Rhodomicrobium]